MFKGGEGVNAGQGEVEWVVAKERFEFDDVLVTGQWDKVLGSPDIRRVMKP